MALAGAGGGGVGAKEAGQKRAAAKKGCGDLGLKCLKGHALLRLKSEGEYLCDGCDKQNEQGKQIEYCSECDWGLCSRCVQSRSKSPKSHSKCRGMGCGECDPEGTFRAARKCKGWVSSKGKDGQAAEDAAAGGGDGVAASPRLHASAASAPAAKKTAERKGKESGPGMECPKGHALQRHESPCAYVCDGCCSDMDEGMLIDYCSKCDWGVCHSCADDLVGEEALAAEEEEVPTSLNCPKGHAVIRLKSTSGYVCDRCNGEEEHGKLIDYCAPCDWGLCPKCAEDLAKGKGDTETGKGAPNEGFGLKCPNKHALCRQKSTSGYICDDCMQQMEQGKRIDYCSQCDWGICCKCADQQQKSDKSQQKGKGDEEDTAGIRLKDIRTKGEGSDGEEAMNTLAKEMWPGIDQEEEESIAIDPEQDPQQQPPPAPPMSAMKKEHPVAMDQPVQPKKRKVTFKQSIELLPAVAGDVGGASALAAAASPESSADGMAGRTPPAAKRRRVAGDTAVQMP